jgi:hypothetical protein
MPRPVPPCTSSLKRIREFRLLFNGDDPTARDELTERFRVMSRVTALHPQSYLIMTRPSCDVAHAYHGIGIIRIKAGFLAQSLALQAACAFLHMQNTQRVTGLLPVREWRCPRCALTTGALSIHPPSPFSLLLYKQSFKQVVM